MPEQENTSEKERQIGQKLLEVAKEMEIDADKLVEFINSNDFGIDLEDRFRYWQESESKRKMDEENLEKMNAKRDELSSDFVELPENRQIEMELPHPNKPEFMTYLREKYGLKKSSMGLEDIKKRADELGIKVEDAKIVKWPPKNILLSAEGKLLYLEGDTPDYMKLLVSSKKFEE